MTLTDPADLQTLPKIPIQLTELFCTGTFKVRTNEEESTEPRAPESTSKYTFLPLMIQGAKMSEEGVVVGVATSL